MAEINQYPVTAIKIQDTDWFDIDADQTLGVWESQKVAWSLIKSELQTTLTFNNLGNADLVADANRSYQLVGSLVSNTLDIKTGGGTSIIQYRGDNTAYMATGTLGIGTAPTTSPLTVSASSGNAVAVYNQSAGGTGIWIRRS